MIHCTCTGCQQSPACQPPARLHSITGSRPRGCRGHKVAGWACVADSMGRQKGGCLLQDALGLPTMAGLLKQNVDLHQQMPQ